MNKKHLPLFLPVRSVVFLLIFVIGAVVSGREVDDISSWWSVAATAVNILTILLLVLLAKNTGQTYGELIGYQNGRTKPKQIILICIVILSVGMTGMYLAGFICYGVIPYAAPMMIAPIPKVMAIINALLLPVTTAFAEDGLYLGCGVNNIKNKAAAILVPAFFFALQHCFIPTLLDVRYLIYRFLSFLPLTVMLCWHYYKKRDPVPVMIGHALIDLATVVWIILTSFVPGFYEKMSSM